ncbi:MAG: reverse transcriptase domain-containing protein [Verrucomicrobiota bacterium]
MAAFEVDADRRLLALSQRLLEGRYRHGRYRVRRVFEPKSRLIAVAGVADRIVHTALHNALAPWFNRRLIDDTYACLPGRGTHRAVFRFLEFYRGYRYMLHLDIGQYFPSVDHGTLLGLLDSKMRDERVVALLEEILASGWRFYARPDVREFYQLSGLDASTPGSGLPIGNLTSQWWGNLYLSGLDHFIKRNLKSRGYVRYMDDFALFSDDARTLVHWKHEVAQWLWEHRLLHLKNIKTKPIATRHPHVFLGTRVRRSGLDPAPLFMRSYRHALAQSIHEAPEAFAASLTARKSVFLA